MYMIKSSNQFITKAVFAVSVVAVAGIVGAVHFAQAAPNSNTSGYGTTSQQATAAADKFQAGLDSSTITFIEQVATLSATAKSQLQANGVVSSDTFDANFVAATNTYGAASSAAFDKFRTAVQGFANTAQSKDQFIDEFNHAKADYFNQLDAAKNQLAASLSNLGNNANVTKDQFMNGYNSDRDAYGNNLEQLKNDFAATVSNL